MWKLSQTRVQIFYVKKHENLYDTFVLKKFQLDNDTGITPTACWPRPLIAN